MGGKRNKSKKFLQQRAKKRAKVSKSKKNATAAQKSNNHPTQEKPKNLKKTRDLFNAGINALNEQPDVDVGHNYNMDHDQTNTTDNGVADDWSDVISLQSEITILDDDDFVDIDENDEQRNHDIDDLFFNLGDKNSKVRIQTLHKIVDDLRRRRINDIDLQPRLQQFYQRLANCVRKGGIEEQLEALDAICLSCITMQENVDFLVQNFQSLMLQLIQRPKSAVIQIKAMEVWSCMVWTLNETASKMKTVNMFEYFWNYNAKLQSNDEKDSVNDSDDNDDDMNGNDDNKQSHKRISSDIMICALESWLFLITSIGSSAGIGSLLDSYASTLLNLLKMEDTNTKEKCMIGKTLTVLIDNYNDAKDNDPAFEEQDIDLSHIMHEFNSLKSINQAHRKKENLIQRSKFRDFVKTLDHKWTPTIVIKLHNEKFEIKGWNLWIQYHALKKVLMNGLQPHLLHNDTIKSWFNIDIAPDFNHLSKSEKNSKCRVHVANQRIIKNDRSKKRDEKRKFMFAANE